MYPNWGQIQQTPCPNHYPVFPSTQFISAPTQYQVSTWSYPMNSGNNIYSQNMDAPYRIPCKTQELWSTGLFDCYMDYKNCFITGMCPCITFGQVAEIVEEGNTSCGSHGTIFLLLSVFVIPCVYTCFFRAKLRRKYMLKEVPFWDWIVHYFCLPCALCQEFRELQNRGFDVSAGWEENVKRQNQGMGIALAAPPVVYTEMRR